MESGAIKIGIYIVIISVLIYLIKNKEIFESKCKKIFKIFILCIFVLGFYNIYSNVKKIDRNISYYKIAKKDDLFFEEFDNKIKEESNFYKEIMKKDYGNVEKEPYIPEGFYYVEGSVESGFVIEDKNLNQYVWVPCTNKENENIAKLEKKDFSDKLLASMINYQSCADLEYKEFMESALKYGGFYISRFELGIENDNVVSKINSKIWTGINRDEAIQKINNMYSNVNCRLINGYAYDTVLTWVKNNNDIKIEKINYMEEKNVISGRNKYNNIYDLADNVMEITSEDFYDTIICRGFDYSQEQELNSRYNLYEKAINYEDRINLLAYRSIIYK